LAEGERWGPKDPNFEIPFGIVFLLEKAEKTKIFPVW